MTCYCNNELMDEAQIVYDDLEKNGCNPNAATFRILIFYLCNKERYKTDSRRWRRKVVEITTVIFTTILHPFYKKGKSDEAEKL
uniref:Uncharacterized protein n=1 Tax=Solanum lycopersicum TaxID=4081 RepID=A0A3Q7FV80_SOLLC